MAKQCVEMVSHPDKPLYLWKVNKNTFELTVEKFEEYEEPGKYKLDYVFNDKKNFIMHRIRKTSLDVYKNNRVLSFSGDREYIVNIISKAMFRKTLDYQYEYREAEAIFTKFKETNTGDK